MEILPAVIAAAICGVSIYAVSVLINVKIRRLNMKKMRIQAVVMPIIVFIVMLLISNT